MTRRAVPAALVGALLALVLMPLLAAAPAGAAGTITISLTALGPKPASINAAVGDTVTFLNADLTFVHQVASKSTNWTFRSRPLAPGERFTTPALTKAGEYDYQGVNLDSFTGKVLVPASAPAAAPSAAPAPSRSAAAATAPAASHAASPATSAAPSAASAAPSQTGGTAEVPPPPLAGGFGAIFPANPVPGASGPAPAVAPLATALPGQDAAGGQSGASGVASGAGRLPEPRTGRRYGLPAALAAVAFVGVASLLVRVLLAHPAARRRRSGTGSGDVPATVD